MRAGVLFTSLADLVLGVRCAGCGCPALGACAACRAAITGQPPILVPLLPPGLPPVLAGGPYADELRRVLLAAKERGALGLVPLLGDRVAAGVARWALGEGSGGPVVLAPVPTARAHVARRGVDLPAALAGRASRRLSAAGLPARTWTGLTLVGRPRDQSELGRADRLANLAQVLAVSGEPPSGHLVVVDDIVTTGATIGEAVRACVAAGVPVAAAVTVAATVRRGAR